MTITAILNLLLLAAIAANVIAFMRAIKINRDAEAAFDNAKNAFDKANDTFRDAIKEFSRPRIRIVHHIHEDPEVEVEVEEVKDEEETEQKEEEKEEKEEKTE